MIDIKVLRYFLALTKTQSITAAAEYLNLTQPTLSRQLSDLEERLNTQLFIRGSRKITLTEEGIKLRKHAEEILELVQKTEAEFQTPNETLSGDIYIGSGETYTIGLITQIIKDLQKNYPKICIHIFSGNADEVTERIDKGLLDFGIIIEPAYTSKYQSLTLPIQDHWGVLMRKDHPLAQKDFIEPQDLWDLPLILSKQKYVDHRITQWIKRDYEQLNIVATYNLIYNASQMVEKEIGFALCLDKIINTTGISPLCFKPLKPSLNVHVKIIWKKYQLFSKAASLLLQQFNQEFTSINI